VSKTRPNLAQQGQTFMPEESLGLLRHLGFQGLGILLERFFQPFSLGNVRRMCKREILPPGSWIGEMRTS